MEYDRKNTSSKYDAMLESTLRDFVIAAML